MLLNILYFGISLLIYKMLIQVSDYPKSNREGYLCELKIWLENNSIWGGFTQAKQLWKEHILHMPLKMYKLWMKEQRNTAFQTLYKSLNFPYVLRLMLVNSIHSKKQQLSIAIGQKYWTLAYFHQLSFITHS